MTRIIAHLPIVLTILLTVVGQLAMRYRMRDVVLPTDGVDRAKAMFWLMFDPLVMSCYVMALLASFAWMLAVNRFPLAYAYPFMSLNFVFVVGLSALFFHEPLNLQRVLGVALIVIGTLAAARA